MFETLLLSLRCHLLGSDQPQLMPQYITEPHPKAAIWEALLHKSCLSRIATCTKPFAGDVHKTTNKKTPPVDPYRFCFLTASTTEHVSLGLREGKQPVTHSVPYITNSCVKLEAIRPCLWMSKDGDCILFEI